MLQQTLFDLDAGPVPIVNVASVPQRSPFRYPGGKTWLVPWIRRWLGTRSASPTEFIEPFAGGGIVSLTVAAERLAGHVTLVELDAQVAAVWQTILQDEGGAAWLGAQIARFDLTPEHVRAVLAQPATTRRDLAFQTLLKNRVNRGGILANGAGLIKNGEAGRGLRSRWYPDTLRRRIMAIAAIRSRISFVQGDGLCVLRDNATCADAVFFIDPPYSVGGKRAGTRLYTHNELDHDALFARATTLTGDFLMTYDDSPEVRERACSHGLDVQPVAMKNTHHARMTELLIGRDLDWARQW
jgi:DNA adenine methylase